MSLTCLQMPSGYGTRHSALHVRVSVCLTVERNITTSTVRSHCATLATCSTELIFTCIGGLKSCPYIERPNTWFYLCYYFFTESTCMDRWHTNNIYFRNEHSRVVMKIANIMLSCTPANKRLWNLERSRVWYTCQSRRWDSRNAAVFLFFLCQPEG